MYLQFTLENGSISILPCRFIPVAVKHAFPPGWLGHDGRHRRGQRCFVAGLWWHFGWDRAWWPPSCLQQSFPGVVVDGYALELQAKKCWWVVQGTEMVDVFRAEVPGACFTRLYGILLLWLTMLILSFRLSLDDARKFFWCALWVVRVPFGIWLGCCLFVFEAFGGSESDRHLRFMEPSLSFSMSTVDLTDLVCGSREELWCRMGCGLVWRTADHWRWKGEDDPLLHGYQPWCMVSWGLCWRWHFDHTFTSKGT